MFCGLARLEKCKMAKFFGNYYSQFNRYPEMEMISIISKLIFFNIGIGHSYTPRQIFIILQLGYHL